MLGSLLGLGGALVWGASQVLSKPGLREIDLVRFVLIRALTGLMFVVPFGVMTTGFVFPGLPAIGAAVVVGVVDCFIGVLLHMLALQRMDSHEVAPLANSAPLWGVLAAWIGLGERVSWIVLGAAFLVVAGAFLLTRRRTTEDSGRHRLSGLGYALGAGICWGVAETVPAKYCMSQGMNPAAFQLVVTGTTAVLWAMAALASRRRRWIGNRRKAIAAGVFTGFTGFFLGWTLWLYGLQRSPASVLAPLRGMTILFAVVGSVIFLKERPTRTAAFGAALIMAGVLLVLVLN